MQHDAASREYEIALQALANSQGSTLVASENAKSGMRHERIIRDAARNETPVQAWNAMQVQGAIPGTVLEIHVARNEMEYCTKLYWKFTKRNMSC